MPRLLYALAAAALAASFTGAPASAARRCSVTTSFTIYAIPSGDENDTKDVYVRGLPRNARRLGVRFVSARDGRPVGVTAFPLQTWAVRIEGFRPDGLLLIRITLTGDGYGMPVAKVARWRAIVGYDC